MDRDSTYAYLLILSGLVLAVWGGYSALDLTLRGESKLGSVKNIEKLKRPTRSGDTETVYEHTVSAGGKIYRIVMSKSKNIGDQLKFRIIENNRSNYSVPEDNKFPFNIFAGGFVLILIGGVYAKYLSTNK